MFTAKLTIEKVRAARRTNPSTAASSRARIESTTYRPMPGHKKIVSTKTSARGDANCSPAMVVIGRRAFLNSVAPDDRPLG